MKWNDDGAAAMELPRLPPQSQRTDYTVVAAQFDSIVSILANAERHHHGHPNPRRKSDLTESRHSLAAAQYRRSVQCLRLSIISALRAADRVNSGSESAEAGSTAEV